MKPALWTPVLLLVLEGLQSTAFAPAASSALRADPFAAGKPVSRCLMMCLLACVGIVAVLM